MKAKEDVDDKVSAITRLEAEVAQLLKQKQEKTDELQGMILQLQTSQKAETARLEEQLSALNLAKVPSESSVSHLLMLIVCEATPRHTKFCMSVPRDTGGGWGEL